MELLFPIKGLHVGFPVSKQPANTSPHLNNVRPYDTLDNRIRGGQRPGLSQKYTDQIGDHNLPIIAMCSVTVID